MPLNQLNIADPLMAAQKYKANKLSLQQAEESRIDQSNLRDLRGQAMSGDKSAIVRMGVIDPASAAATQKVLENISTADDNQKARAWQNAQQLMGFSSWVETQPDKEKAFTEGKKHLKSVGLDMDILGDYEPNKTAYLVGFANKVKEITAPVKNNEVQSSSILPGGVVQTVTKGGQTNILQPTPEEAEIIRKAEERGVDIQQQRAQGRGLGTDSAKLATTALDRTEKLRSNNFKLRQVITEIRNGAETGPISNYLPSFRASTKRLIQIKNELGLDVVGSVTFGALSEGELNMAMDTALPTGLQGPELVDWAENKINAQEKLADYLEDQAIFLSKPGNTAADWAATIKAKKAQNSNASTIGRFSVEVVQ